MPSRQVWPVCTRNTSEYILWHRIFFKAYFHLIRVLFLRLQSGYNTNLKCPKVSTWASPLRWQCLHFPTFEARLLPSWVPQQRMTWALTSAESSNSHLLLCSHSRPTCHPSSLQVSQLVSCLRPHPQVCFNTATGDRVWKQWLLSSWRVRSRCFHEGPCHGALHLLYPPCALHPMPRPSPPWGLCLFVTSWWPSFGHPVEKRKSRSYCSSHFLLLFGARPCYLFVQPACPLPTGR